MERDAIFFRSLAILEPNPLSGALQRQALWIGKCRVLYSSAQGATFSHLFSELLSFIPAMCSRSILSIQLNDFGTKVGNHFIEHVRHKETHKVHLFAAMLRKRSSRSSLLPHLMYDFELPAACPAHNECNFSASCLASLEDSGAADHGSIRISGKQLDCPFALDARFWDKSAFWMAPPGWKKRISRYTLGILQFRNVSGWRAADAAFGQAMVV